jgi:hypothetical protein
MYMKDKTLANWVALNHIAEQRLQQQMPQLGKTDGDVDYAGQKWHWRQETVNTAVKGMIRMDVMVRPADIKADDNRSWYVTLSGIMGDAVGQPRGDMPLWGTGTMTPIPGMGGGSTTGPNPNGPNPNGPNTLGGGTNPIGGGPQTPPNPTPRGLTR